METDAFGETLVLWARKANISSLSWDGVLVFLWSPWQDDREGILAAPMGFFTKCLGGYTKPARGYKAETNLEPPGGVSEEVYQTVLA